MNPYCDNPLCENPGAKEIAVSVISPGDQKRTLCTACEEVYSWGVQHGRFSVEHHPLWIAVVTDRGIVEYARAFTSESDAEAALVAYLRKEHGYGRHEDDAPCWFDWIGEQAYLTAEIVEQDALANHPPLVVAEEGRPK